jgi:hypothetical protein
LNLIDPLQIKKKTKTKAANLLGNFGPALTYEVFIHLGLVLAIPVSAG